MENEIIVVLDFGGQYNQLIARRVREHNVYCEVIPYNVEVSRIKEMNPKGIIFTGGPASVYADKAPKCDNKIFELGIPMLGICYGGQLMTEKFGGKVTSADTREYGKTELNITKNSKLFRDVSLNSICWMSHTDFIESTPKDFEITATTKDCPVAAMENNLKKMYAVQFHPEVEYTEIAKSIIKNFLYEICECRGEWTTKNYIDDEIAEIRKQVGNKKVLCALSGGVDSSVAAVLVNKAIGDNLTCVFVDHGLLRKDEGDWVIG